MAVTRDTLTDGTRSRSIRAVTRRPRSTCNNQHITFAYNGSNEISTITDNYGNITTFSYSGGYLQTIKDPAGRFATFTHSGGEPDQASRCPTAAPGAIPTPRAAS